jgi:hypothetical protein
MKRLRVLGLGVLLGVLGHTEGCGNGPDDPPTFSLEPVLRALERQGLEVRGTTFKDTYETGEPVRIGLVVTNRSRQTHRLQFGGPGEICLVVDIALSTSLIVEELPLIEVLPEATVIVEILAWDQRRWSGEQMPPGHYGVYIYVAGLVVDSRRLLRKNARTYPPLPPEDLQFEILPPAAESEP